VGEQKNLKVPVRAIVIGERDREDLGEVKALAASIAAVGLLHPVVVTQALALVAGGRRLAAVTQLGWTEVPVTVVNLETVAETLRAEADENTERKPLTPYEAARARERRARVLAEDAARRQAVAITERDERGRAVATSAKLAEVDPGPGVTQAKPKPAERETRKAAAIGTGYSGSTLDKVDTIRTVAERGVVPVGRGREKAEVPVPEPVREVARRELDGVKKTGAAVDRAHRIVAEAIEQHLPPDPDEPHRKWRQNFLAALSQGHKAMQFEAAAVAERADGECLDELRRLVEGLSAYHARVRTLVAETMPDNVRPLRSA
jgi:ParB family chromosome partitioning protein